MRAHRIAVVGCTALLAVTAAACGGSDDDNEPTGGSTPAAAGNADTVILGTTDKVVALASDLAEEEALRGYDAIHLATALRAKVALFTSADAPLCEAAGRRGLHVADPLDA